MKHISGTIRPHCVNNCPCRLPPFYHCENKTTSTSSTTTTTTTTTTTKTTTPTTTTRPVVTVKSQSRLVAQPVPVVSHQFSSSEKERKSQEKQNTKVGT